MTDQTAIDFRDLVGAKDTNYLPIENSSLFVRPHGSDPNMMFIEFRVMGQETLPHSIPVQRRTVGGMDEYELIKDAFRSMKRRAGITLPDRVQPSKVAGKGEIEERKIEE